MEKEFARESLEEVSKRNMAVWLETLKTKNPEKVSRLYSEKNTFLPTVSGRLRKGKVEAKDYFEHFLDKNPEGEVVEEEIQPLGENTYLHSGMYNFEVDGKEGRILVPARFTYVWQKENDGKWQIIHHHSSARPEDD